MVQLNLQIKTAETKVTGGVSLTGKITHISLAVLYSITNLDVLFLCLSIKMFSMVYLVFTVI